MNKKAQDIFDVTKKSVFWMFMGLIIAMIILTFAYFLVNYQGDITEIPPELQAEFIMLRFTENADCFAYQDEFTGRVYPGVIDLDKFTKERLDSCYSTGEDGRYDINFQLTLSVFNETIAADNFYNVVDSTVKKTVLVRTEENDTIATLTIEIQGEI